MTWKPTLTLAEFWELPCPNDGIKHLREVYDEAVNALHAAGSDRTKRREAEKMAIEHIGDVVRQLEFWEAEARQEELRRAWGTPILPSSPPTPDDPTQG